MNKRVAVVYDWIDKWGGVERVLLTLHEMFPGASFYTSVYDEKKAAWAKGISVKASFLNSFPRFVKESRIASLPFYPMAFESLDFTGFDLVISVTSSFAKAVVTHPGTRHLCYLLTPTRYLWSHKEKYLKGNVLAKPFVDHLKKWDLVAAKRPDRIISISKTAQARCKKYYGLDSEVIYPPFDFDHWSKIKRSIKGKSGKITGDYFLVVSRLETYKNVDKVIKAFKGRDEKLVVVGEGTEKKALEEMAGKNVTFMSNLSDSDLGSVYSNAKALVMPQEEDFGYVSLEAQFFGTPVITNSKGGATETVRDGETGILFDGAKKESLSLAIARFAKIGYNLKAKVKRIGEKEILRYDKKNFIKEFKKNL